MRYGINLLLWTTFVTEQHHALFGALRDMGYDGVELPMARGDEAHYAALGRELDRVGLARASCLALGAHEDPASPDPAVRRAALERLREVIGITAAMGGGLVCGPLHSAWKVFRPPTADQRRWSAEVLRAAAEEAQAAGVVLAIEALNRFESALVTTVADALEIVRAADHPALGVHYDTHHMHIEEPDVADALERAAPHLRHVHVSENHRGVPGTGQVDWAGTFEGLRRAGYDGWLTIEAFSRVDPEFAAAIHIWRDTFESPDALARDGLAFMRRSWDGASR